MKTTRNIFASYGASAVSVVVALLATPAYIYFLGIEAYALTGFLVTLQTWFAVLDFGLSPALSRSVTQFAAGRRDEAWIGSIFRAMERIFLIAACVIATVVAFSAPWAAHHWLGSSGLSSHVVASSIGLMGVICGIRLWYGLYVGGLTGLQHLEWLSGFTAITIIVRLLLSLSVLAWFWTDIRALMLVNTLYSLGELIVIRWRFRHALPAKCFQVAIAWGYLRDIKPYALGLTLTTAVTICLTGIDKLVLSALVPLKTFGYYMVAFTASQVLYRLVSPVYSAVLPRLTELVSTGDAESFATLYHRAAQAVVVLTAPIGLIIAMCPDVAVLAWTGDIEVAQGAADTLRLLALATVLHCCMYIPYAAQLAHGWTSLALYINIAMSIILVPVMIFGVYQYGMIAAAWSWLALNVIYLIIGQALMTKRILQGHMWRWYAQDTLPVLLMVTLIALLFHQFIPTNLGRLGAIVVLIAGSLIATISAVIVSPLRQVLLIKVLRKLYS